LAPKSKQKEFNASIAIKIWVDVPVQAEDLNSALALAKEIKLDKILSSSNMNSVLDSSTPKITGVYAVENWDE